jgi:phage repressor protein C with HTH and peptisase S24 domain
MAPAICAGDVVAIDTADAEIGGGGIFAIEESDIISVWQVELLHGDMLGRIRCKPRNSTYSHFDLELGKQARIVGRVKGKFTSKLV